MQEHDTDASSMYVILNLCAKSYAPLLGRLAEETYNSTPSIVAIYLHITAV